MSGGFPAPESRPASPDTEAVTKPKSMRWTGALLNYESAQIVDWINVNGGEAQYEPNVRTCHSDGWHDEPRIFVLQADGTYAYMAPGDEVVMGKQWFDAPLTGLRQQNAAHFMNRLTEPVREFTVRRPSPDTGSQGC